MNNSDGIDYRLNMSLSTKVLKECFVEHVETSFIVMRLNEIARLSSVLAGVTGYLDR